MAFIESLKNEYSNMRENYYKKDRVNDNNIDNCRKNKFSFDWKNYKPVAKN